LPSPPPPATPPSPPPPTPPPGGIALGQCLYAGQRIMSEDGRFSALMQENGNLVLYQGPVSGEGLHISGNALWASNTYRHTPKPNRLCLQTNNALVLSDSRSEYTHSLSTVNDDGVCRVDLQNNGNLVLHCSNGTHDIVLWSSQTCCH